MGAGCETEHAGAELDRQCLAQIDDRVQNHGADDGWPQDWHMHPVDEHADRHRYDNGAPGRDHAAGGRLKRVGDRHREHGVDHHQEEEDDDHEQDPSPLADDVAGQCPNRLRLVPDTGPDGSEIVDAGKEHRADDHPDERRQPAPDDRDPRSDDWCRAGDGREMVPPEHDAVCGHVVDVVALGVCGRDEVRVELVDLFGDELRVEPIPEEDHRETDDGEKGLRSSE